MHKMKKKNENLNKKLNIEEINTEIPTPIGSKKNIKEANDNKEEIDKTNLACDKTSLGESQIQKEVIKDPHSNNNIDKNNIQDLTDNKKPNDNENKENNYQLCLCDPTDIQKKLYDIASESLEISSGTIHINSQLSVFGGNKSKYYYSINKSESNINNFQGKLSKNQYLDGNLQIINELEERN